LMIVLCSAKLEIDEFQAKFSDFFTIGSGRNL